MTLKELRDLGFEVRKSEGHKFIVTKGQIKAQIIKVTDTKFRFGDNEATPHIEKLLEQIKNLNEKD